MGMETEQWYGTYLATPEGDPILLDKQMYAKYYTVIKTSN
jgi:hypothetical protein